MDRMTAILHSEPPDLSRTVEEALPDLSALEGEQAGPTTEAFWNGQPTRSQQFRSPLAPSAVASIYARQFAGSNIVAERFAELSKTEDIRAPSTALVSRFDSPYCSMVATRGEDGRHIGVVAFPHPEGGSTYFLSETQTVAGPARRAKKSRNEAYDVPAPPFATEDFAIDDMGEEGSRLALYSSRAGRDRILTFYRETLPTMGWSRLEEEGGLVNERLETGYVMLYRRDMQELVVAAMPRKSGIEGVTIVFRNKR